jgi:hypothetical protein
MTKWASFGESLRRKRKSGIILIVSDCFHRGDSCYELGGDEEHQDNGCHRTKVEEYYMSEFEVDRNTAEII